MATKSKSRSKNVQRKLKRIVIIPRGGVSPVLSGPAARGTKKPDKVMAPVSMSGAHPNFSYHGGPIIKLPQVITSFWGAEWSDASHQARANRLDQFIKDLLASKYMNILSQYGVGSGAGIAGAFVKSTFVNQVPKTLTESIIHKTIQGMIKAGTIPEPIANSILIIYLDESIGVRDRGQKLVLCEPTNDSAFGYHSFFKTKSRHFCYYAIIPALNDTCLTESCPSDTDCSLHLVETQEQRQTQVTSHEFAEMVTDPHLDAWYEPSAENGDICNGQRDTITVGGNTWTVQRMYSKYDDMHSNGAIMCVTAPASPLPKLSPGPA